MLKDYGIDFKKTDKILVGYINFRGEIKDILGKLEDLNQKCKDFSRGSLIAIIDYGVYSNGGKDIEVCIPIKESVELDNLETKYLESKDVLCKMHKGPLTNLSETFRQLSNYFDLHGLPGTEWLRIVIHNYNQNNPDENKIEIQSGIHPWEKRLANKLDAVLGRDTRMEIMKDNDKSFTIESSKEERAQWIKSMLKKLDKMATDYEKYDILSCCAHDFSQKRINFLNGLYKKTGSIEEVLKVMYDDYDWYENPKLIENTIYVTKVPYNRDGYENAKTLEEKRINYCHCPMIRTHLSEGISPTFCNCSAGWYRRLWEGILERPIRIKILASLVKGDQNCKFAIFLPIT